MLLSICHVDSELQKGDFLANNGPNSLRPWDQKLSVCYGDAQKPTGTSVDASEKISNFYVCPRVIVLHRNNFSCMHISWQSTDSIMGHLYESERGPLVNCMVIKNLD